MAGFDSGQKIQVERHFATTREELETAINLWLINNVNNENARIVRITVANRTNVSWASMISYFKVP